MISSRVRACAVENAINMAIKTATPDIALENLRSILSLLIVKNNLNRLIKVYFKSII
jgi:hypothetical protein